MEQIFDKFCDYMYTLLVGPLKKVRRSANNFYILFKVLGARFDENKEDFFKAREETYIISASEPILNIFGKERDMPRLEGEALENYRFRLMIKNEIAEQAGTNIGIQNALIAAGFSNTHIEPFHLYDPERWAEFIVYLGENTVGVINDILSIDREVAKIKPASGKANYAIERTRRIVVESEYKRVGLCYMMCGLQQCGAPVNLY